MTGKIFIDDLGNGTSFVDEQQVDAMTTNDIRFQLQRDVPVGQLLNESTKGVSKWESQ